MEQESETKRTLDVFCENTAIPACVHLIERSKYDRIFWLSFIILGIGAIAYITQDTAKDRASEPVYITLDASSLKITDVDFPGVAICDINRISKRRAIELAHNITKYTKSKTFDEALDLVKLLGNFYDNNIYGINEFAYLQGIFNEYDNTTTEKDMILRLVDLMVPCSELLTNCSWDSVDYNCSAIFHTRLTDSGFCCVFNYIRQSSEALILSETNHSLQKLPRKFLGTGVGRGLSMTVNNNISDYFHTSLATRGSLLKTFLPGDFPDLTSGSLREIIVQESSEVFINVEADTLVTMEHVHSLPINLRKCKFKNEERTPFGDYTSSNCYVSCKLKSIMALCSCIPLMIPIAEGTNTDHMSFCSLVDIPCLNKYQGKWSRYYPTDITEEEAKGLSLELEDSLKCDNCLPNCNDVTYRIDTNYFEFFSEHPDYPNSSRIHVFSNKAYTNLYKKLVTITWYEALSTFGGIVSILLGMSIINFVEIAVLLLKLLSIKLKSWV